MRDVFVFSDVVSVNGTPTDKIKFTTRYVSGTNFLGKYNTSFCHWFFKTFDE